MSKKKREREDSFCLFLPSRLEHEGAFSRAQRAERRIRVAHKIVAADAVPVPHLDRHHGIQGRSKREALIPNGVQRFSLHFGFLLQINGPALALDLHPAVGVGQTVGILACQSRTGTNNEDHVVKRVGHFHGFIFEIGSRRTEDAQFETSASARLVSTIPQSKARLLAVGPWHHH